MIRLLVTLSILFGCVALTYAQDTLVTEPRYDILETLHQKGNTGGEVYMPIRQWKTC